MITRSRILTLALLGMLLVAAPLAFWGCGAEPAATTESTTASSTTDVSGAAASGSNAETTASVPAGAPTEIQRFGEGPELWKAWLLEGSVVWMQSAGPAARYAMGYAGSPNWDTVFRVATADGSRVEDIPGVRLSAPSIPESPPYGISLPLAWAEVLPGADGRPFKLVWAAPPEMLSETYLYHGLFSWSPGGVPLELLPQSALSLRAQASGDAVAIPIPIASFTEGRQQPTDPASWEKLLMMTANMSAPVEVDPQAPRLSEQALAGLSPYFTLLTDSSSGPRPAIYDLRTGEKLALEFPKSYPGPVVEGHHATWWTETGDVYLADLDTQRVEKVLALSTDRESWPAVALGEEWLIVLKPWSSFDRESAMKDPSQHPGADLIALHLPDLRRVDIPAVVPKGQVGSVQVSGNSVLLTVSPAIEPMPHNEPEWTALRVLRLE